MPGIQLKMTSNRIPMESVGQDTAGNRWLSPGYKLIEDLNLSRAVCVIPKAIQRAAVSIPGLIVVI
jgi:hypothetical protein